MAQRFPEGLDFQISRNSAHEGGVVVSLTHRQPLLPEMFLVLIFIGAESKYVTEKSSDTNGNRSRDSPTSSAGPTFR